MQSLKKNEIKTHPKIIFYLLGLILLLSVFDFLLSGLRYLQYFSSAIYVIILIKHIPKRGAFNKAFTWFFVLFGILIIRGLSLSNYIKYFLNDIYMWSFFVLILFFNSKASLAFYKNKIPELFARLLYITVPFTIVIIILFGSISDTFNRSVLSDDINSTVLYYPILYAPLLVPFVFEFNRKLRFIVLLGNSLLLIIGIITATRVAFVVPLFAFFTLLFQFKKGIKAKGLFTILSFICLFIIFWNIIPKDLNSLFNSKVEYLFSRISNENDITGGRSSEVEGLFTDYRLDEFIIGRGAGGAQKFGFWKDTPTPLNLGVPLAHFGFLHLLLKGGFLLLLSIYGLAIWSIINLYRRGDRQYMFVILLFLFYEISYTQFLNPIYLIFLWISFSYSLRLKVEKARIDSRGIFF